MTARDRKRFITSLGLAVLIGLVMCATYIVPALRIPGLDDVQNLVNDAAVFKTRGESNTAKQVALVHIDEKSISGFRTQYGRFFSWPRTIHAQVLKNLADAGARVVVYDVLFDAPGCPASAPQPCEDDVAFTDAIKYARQRAGGGTQIVLAEAGDFAEPPAPGEGIRFKDAILPLDSFRSAATALAHVHPFPDSDGSVRRVPLVATIKGQEVPALALQGAALFLRRPTAIDEKGPSYVKMAARPIPTDEGHRVIVNYQGKPSHLPDVLKNAPVPVVSYIDVYNNTFDKNIVKDKLLFVGLTAIGFADDYQAPTSPAGVKMSGVEIHAQTAEMILRGAYLVQQDPWSTVAVIFVLSLIVGVVMARFQPVLAGGITLALLLAFVIATVIYSTLSEGSLNQASNFVVLNNVYPTMSMFLAFVVVMLYRIVFEQAEQRATRGVMGKYLSPAVMTEVLKDPDALKLGGQKIEMTVLFSDIRGFTSMSEKMDPQELVHFLNEYLTEMTNIVYENEGVLDKYIGDAVMAFWGAPKAQPNHAELACRTAFHMMRRLRELRAGWEQRGLPHLDIGVGINTGFMTVGNVGSKSRFDYTIIGDSVNLGSRLEATNKEYGTNIILSEATLLHLNDAFNVRFLDLIAVKGKKEAAPVYELLGPKDDLGSQPKPGFLEQWEIAMGHYKAQRFDDARTAFQRVLEIEPDDGPALAYIERCAEMAVAPPGESWNGVFVMTHK